MFLLKLRIIPATCVLCSTNVGCVTEPHTCTSNVFILCSLNDSVANFSITDVLVSQPFDFSFLSMVLRFCISHASLIHVYVSLLLSIISLFP
jgi:hypothetical protein